MMKSLVRIWMLAISISILIVACTSQKQEPKMSESKPAAGSSFAAKIRRFAPTEITAGTSHLSEGDRKALAKLIDAATLLDPLFLRQVWSGNEALLKKLQAEASPEGRELLHYFTINKGPWSRLDKNEPFIEGAAHENRRRQASIPMT